MADFALWSVACKTALWSAGTIARAYAANRQAAIESFIEADPVASCVTLKPRLDHFISQATQSLAA
jgi:hypothetical protein